MAECLEQDEIKAVKAQIICQGVEERIIDHKKPTGFEVNSQFYEHKEGLRNSIRNFYENQLNAFPKAYQERILQKKEQGSAISPLDQKLDRKALGSTASYRAVTHRRKSYHTRKPAQQCGG